MQNTPSIGLNRTGFQMSPFDTEELLEAAEERSPTPDTAALGLDAQRQNYIADAGIVGSVPMPGSLKGAINMTVSKLSGKHPEMLIDKLGERLAFERSGTRLYDALIAKYQAAIATAGEEPLRNELGAIPGSDLPEMPLDTLQRIRSEELQHFKLLSDAMEKLGADPTAQTPCADISAVSSLGVMQVLTDPRTNLPQCLNAILTAEMTDNAGWELLADLTEQAGHPDMAAQFRQALHQEQQHLAIIKNWLSKLVLAAA
ncbi:ferritin-like domain-containing protein [Chitinimonas lacunae]|uniref:Ferritin-like domain-containing protein n=1 Tax=Chitinimonas lacunae TaxID=1963018 RepID=A0ABV8MM07_9NEIS